MEKVIKAIFRRIEETPGDVGLYSDAFECVKHLWGSDRPAALRCIEELRKLIRAGYRCMENPLEYVTLDTIMKESYHIAAHDDFDSYLIFLEWNREPRKKFYLPRRKVLLRLVRDLQDLEDGVISFLSISLPARTGKSTLCIMFMTWVMGRHPEVASVMSGHSDKLTDSFYGEVLSIITDKQYNWGQVFPTVKLVDKSAKDESIDLGTKKRFPTLTCRSVEGTLTGAVEIGTGGVLYCDDMVKDFEESISADRMQAKWDAYVNQLKDRKKDGAKELMVGTRWNVLDPIGRTMLQYADDPMYRFTVIPALDENDESNFQYDYGVGFTTEYYHDMRESTDDATWWAKYMGQPYVREGLLFPRGELNWYNGTLPDVAPDRIVTVCDVAWGGGDFLSMPIAYVYNGVAYVQDVAFSDKDKTVTVPLVCGKLVSNNVPMAQFEANNGGTEYADKVDEQLKATGHHINISARRSPTTTSKMARIIQYAPDIKKFYFVDDKHSTKEYKAFMNQLCNYVQTGKNAHDDAADSLAMLAELLFNNYGEVTVMQRPF